MTHVYGIFSGDHSLLSLTPKQYLKYKDIENFVLKKHDNKSRLFLICNLSKDFSPRTNGEQKNVLVERGDSFVTFDVTEMDDDVYENSIGSSNNNVYFCNVVEYSNLFNVNEGKVLAPMNATFKKIGKSLTFNPSNKTTELKFLFNDKLINDNTQTPKSLGLKYGDQLSTIKLAFDVGMKPLTEEEKVMLKKYKEAITRGKILITQKLSPENVNRYQHVINAINSLKPENIFDEVLNKIVNLLSFEELNIITIKERFRDLLYTTILDKFKQNFTSESSQKILTMIFSTGEYYFFSMEYYFLKNRPSLEEHLETFKQKKLKKEEKELRELRQKYEKPKPISPQVPQETREHALKEMFKSFTNTFQRKIDETQDDKVKNNLIFIKDWFFRIIPKENAEIRTNLLKKVIENANITALKKHEILKDSFEDELYKFFFIDQQIVETIFKKETLDVFREMIHFWAGIEFIGHSPLITELIKKRKTALLKRKFDFVGPTPRYQPYTEQHFTFPGEFPPEPLYPPKKKVRREPIGIFQPEPKKGITITSILELIHSSFKKHYNSYIDENIRKDIEIKKGLELVKNSAYGFVKNTFQLYKDFLGNYTKEEIVKLKKTDLKVKFEEFLVKTLLNFENWTILSNDLYSEHRMIIRVIGNKFIKKMVSLVFKIKK